MNDKEKDIKSSVMEAIERGEVKMRPKWQFVLESLLWFVGAMITALALLFIASFIVFVLRQTGAWFAPSFGMRGMFALFIAMPWALVLLTIIFVVVLELLVRHYGFSYRRPLVVTVLGIALFAVLGGIVVADSPFHGRLLREAREKRLPVAGLLYERFGMERLNHIHKGIIVTASEGSFDMETYRREVVRVLVPPAAMFPYGIDFGEGDTVVVIGDRSSGTIQAIGVRKAPDNIDDVRFIGTKTRRFFRLMPQ